MRKELLLLDPNSKGPSGLNKLHKNNRGCKGGGTEILVFKRNQGERWTAPSQCTTPPGGRWKVADVVGTTVERNDTREFLISNKLHLVPWGSSMLVSTLFHYWAPQLSAVINATLQAIRFFCNFLKTTT